MSRCCPRRQLDASGYCREHEPRTLAVFHQVAPMPEACPHCGAEPPGWRMTRDYCTCTYCGHDWTRQITVAGA